MFHTKWQAGAADTLSEFIIDEVGDNDGVPPRNYLDTLPQQTKIQLAEPYLVPADDVVTLGVSAVADASPGKNVRCHAGYFHLSRV